MKSTHYPPLSTTVGSTSPARPSTARSTIRAIPPSPPLSVNEALRIDLAENPARPYSDFLPGSTRPLFGDNADAVQKERVDSLAKQTTSAENYHLLQGYTGSPGAELQRGGAESKRSQSLAHPRSRSHSPQKQSYFPLGQTSQPAAMTREQQATDSMWYSTTEDDIDEETENYGRAPETPTPMSREQRLQAYTPLSAPSPLFPVEKNHSSDGAGPARPKGQPTHELHDKHHLPQHSPSERNFKPHLRDLVSAARTRENFPTTIDEQTTAPVKTGSPRHPTRQVSCSARSTVSGGTAESRRSVFSTPGRDEMERKKALVEIDEGPFAKAVNVQDLDVRRRQVSGKSDESKDREKKRVWRQGCGMSGRCCVM
ncbi:hypothetical protein NX059_007013 [Plenodomus lindquistii]|nr:hypothetical protein NX059_007013 [Plenodomus lindquistii]